MYSFLYKLGDVLLRGLPFIVEGIILILLLIGIWMIFSKNIIYLLNNGLFFRGYRLRDLNDIRSNNPVYNHIRVMLSTIYGSDKPSHIYSFFFITFLLLTLPLLIIGKDTPLYIRISISIISGMTPYGYLSMRLRSKRIEGSFEADRLITELINQYKINYLNIIEAIDKTIINLQNTSITKRLLIRLSMGLKNFRDEQELEKVLDEFTYGIDTQWIHMLSNNIYLAVSDDVDITCALEDILIQLREATRNLEYNKRLNSEAFIIAKYLSPILYIYTVYFAINKFDITISRFIELQFGTSTGLRFFIIILGLTIINFSIVLSFARKKFDF